MDLFLAFLACAAVMLALWLWQIRSRRADWVDAAWAVLIGLQAIGYATFGDGSDEKRLLGALLAVTWSSRLAAHLIQRLAGHDGEDGRYQAMREHFGDRANAFFFVFFLVQAIVAWLFALPAWVVVNDPDAGLGAWVVLGVAIWFISLAGESLADRQLAAFKADPSNRGKVCRVGLWRYSRHPNYFFEWLHWFSYPLVAMGAPNQWVAWLGPVVMLLFLYRVSGIPYTEKQSLKSRGDAYREYQRTTSPFIPWPPKDRDGS
jgi:steroid 5-alpha reductase family enzyme